MPGSASVGASSAEVVSPPHARPAVADGFAAGATDAGSPGRAVPQPVTAAHSRAATSAARGTALRTPVAPMAFTASPSPLGGTRAPYGPLPRTGRGDQAGSGSPAGSRRRMTRAISAAAAHIAPEAYQTTS